MKASTAYYMFVFEVVVHLFHQLVHGCVSVNDSMSMLLVTL
jgi:hypothetical protein